MGAGFAIPDDMVGVSPFCCSGTAPGGGFVGSHPALMEPLVGTASDTEMTAPHRSRYAKPGARNAAGMACDLAVLNDVSAWACRVAEAAQSGSRMVVFQW